MVGRCWQTPIYIRLHGTMHAQNAKPRNVDGDQDGRLGPLLDRIGRAKIECSDLCRERKLDGDCNFANGIVHRLGVTLANARPERFGSG